jgi:hypothetical protein
MFVMVTVPMFIPSQRHRKPQIFQIAESYREGKRVRERIAVILGRLDFLQQSGELALFFP